MRQPLVLYFPRTHNTFLCASRASEYYTSRERTHDSPGAAYQTTYVRATFVGARGGAAVQRSLQGDARGRRPVHDASADRYVPEIYPRYARADRYVPKIYPRYARDDRYELGEMCPRYTRDMPAMIGMSSAAHAQPVHAVSQSPK